MIQRNLRGKGVTIIASYKVFKPPNKPNSSLKISQLHKNQTKILTKKSKIWEGKWLSMIWLSSFLLLRDEFIKENTSIFSHTFEGKQRGYSYQHATVCDRHHEQIVVLARTKCSTFLLLHGHNISWPSVGGQNTLK